MQNLHLSTHMATPNDNNDNNAAIPMRSANADLRNAENYARMNNHSLQNTEEELITTPAATAAHRRYPSSRLQRLYTEKHKVSCSGFLTPPFINVLLCDVKSHTALHQCIVMWCSVSQFYLSVTRKIASQLPLVISLWPLSLTWAPGRLSGVSP